MIWDWTQTKLPEWDLNQLSLLWTCMPITRVGLEPTSSRLMCQHSTNWAIYIGTSALKLEDLALYNTKITHLIPPSSQRSKHWQLFQILKKYSHLGCPLLERLQWRRQRNSLHSIWGRIFCNDKDIWITLKMFENSWGDVADLMILDKEWLTFTPTWVCF